MRSATNSRKASATAGDVAMAAAHDAKSDPVPSAWSHMVRNPSTSAAPAPEPVPAPSLTTLGSKGSAMAATKRLALPSK